MREGNEWKDKGSAYWRNWKVAALRFVFLGGTLLAGKMVKKRMGVT